MLPAAHDHGIALSVDVPPHGVVASVDADRIVQVMSNLLGNALKFTPRGGRVAVRACVEGDLIQVSVSDTGEGIPPRRLDTIFDRLSQGTRQDRRSLGLGLPCPFRASNRAAVRRATVRTIVRSKSCSSPVEDALVLRTFPSDGQLFA